MFERALDALLREVRASKFAECSPRSTKSTEKTPPTRHIPSAIKRAVASRDGHRCTFVAENGTRCGSRAALEYHHVEPFARVRRHRPEEITLYCRAHNRHAAILDFGRR